MSGEPTEHDDDDDILRPLFSTFEQLSRILKFFEIYRIIENLVRYKMIFSNAC